ncbi:MAG: hypothetical protein ACRDYC_14000, partial [Acidimicrobiales bacterium]
RIHRSNLVGMGVLPLQLPSGESVASLGLTGEEVFDITGLDSPDGLSETALSTTPLPKTVTVRAGGVNFEARLRVDGPTEEAYLRAGGVLPYALGQLIQEKQPPGAQPI